MTKSEKTSEKNSDKSSDAGNNKSSAKTKLAKSTTGGQIFTRQVRSSTRSRGQHARTLLALGLGRIGKSNTLPDNPAVRGMVRSVIQWVEVKSVEGTHV